MGEQRCVTPVTPAAPSPVPCTSPAISQVPASPPQSTTPKGKVGAPKLPFRKATASINPSMLNGHGDSAHEGESSSTDEPAAAQKKSPTKRKAKVKRRKGGKKPAVQEEKTKKKAPSESDSDKESGTEKDSEDSVSSNKRAGGKETSGGSNGGTSGTSGSSVNNGGAKKRGRRPKSKNDEPRPPKKARGAGGNGDGSPTPPPRDPSKKPSTSQLKKTGESFLQDKHCFEIAPKLAKCRECRLTQNQRNKEVYNNIFCRFYYFRRLRYTKNGQLAIAGFSDPHLDAEEVSHSVLICFKLHS